MYKTAINSFTLPRMTILTLYFRAMILTDTHTHLNSKQFAADRDDMMQRAIQAGVTRFFVPSIDKSRTESLYDIEARYPGQVFLMMGLHPVYVKDDYEEELAFVEAELARRRFVAVGEIGIDMYWDKSTLPLQQDAFRRQIRMAKQYGLPINIHGRDAFDPIFEILEEEKGDDLRGVFHCFSGNRQQAEQAISYGMKLGIGGVVTFKNGQIDQFLADISLSDIVLETDAPYLAPVPYRGKRNETAYIVHVAEKLAALHGTTVAEVARITTENSRDVYGI